MSVTGHNPSGRGLTTGPDNYLYSIDDGTPNPNIMNLLKTHPTSGVSTVVGSIGTFTFPRLEYNPFDQTMYMMDLKQLYTVSLLTGSSAFVGTISGLTGSFRNYSLAIRSDGAAFMTGNNSGGNIFINFYSLNLATLTATQIGTIVASNGLNTNAELAFLGNTLYALDGDNGNVWTIDTSNASVSLQYNLPGFSLSNPGLAFAAVPEPMTWALLLVGITSAGVILWQRSRMRKRLFETEMLSN